MDGPKLRELQLAANAGRAAAVARAANQLLSRPAGQQPASSTCATLAAPSAAPICTHANASIGVNEPPPQTHPVGAQLQRPRAPPQPGSRFKSARQGPVRAPVRHRLAHARGRPCVCPLVGPLTPNMTSAAQKRTQTHTGRALFRAHKRAARAHVQTNPSLFDTITPPATDWIRPV